MAAPRETDGAGWLESIAFFTREKASTKASTKAIAERVQEAIFYLGKLAEKSPDLVFGVQGLPCHDKISILS